MTDRKEFEEQSRQRCGVGVGQDAVASLKSWREGRVSFAKNPRRNDRSEGGLTLIAENTWRNTRGSRLERLERKPRDLSLIGGARPVDWLTSKTLLRRDTLVSRRFTIREHSTTSIVLDTGVLVVSTDEPFGPRADWQRNRTGIDLRRSISSPEEIRDRSNRRAGRSSCSFPGQVMSLTISCNRYATLFDVFH